MSVYVKMSVYANETTVSAVPLHALTQSPNASSRTLRFPSCTRRLSALRVRASGDQDGARKALEQAFQGKNNLAKKWEEEIKKRELASSDGGGGGDGGGGSRWGGGGGSGDDMDEDFGGQDEPWDWEEAGQTFMATFALLVLYFSITHGPKQVLRLFRLFFRYVRQGFRLRKIPEEYLQQGADEDDEDEFEGDEGDDSDEDSDDDFVSATESEKNSRVSEENNPEDNHSFPDEVELSEDDLPPPSDYRKEKENHMAMLRAKSMEKVMQMYAPKNFQEMDLQEREER